MHCYFAPMEGITGYLYRNAHHEFFDHIDKYFTPFLVPNQTMKFASKELRDVLPKHNRGMRVIPQILTNRADYFLCAAEALEQLGYEEINLNLGCPSGTVVSKNKGSGFLAQRDELNRFLETIFNGLDQNRSERKLSVKTRLGKDDPEEFYPLLSIFNQYPMEELIIHPRIQKDYYKNKPRLEIFKDAITLSKNPICYNGDIFTACDAKKFMEEFPGVDRVMCGRGLIANPGLVDTIREGKDLDKQCLKDFHDAVYHGYQEVLSGDRNVLFKMKELWFYLICVFSDADRYAKKIKKSEHFCDYEQAVERLFAEQDMVKNAGFRANR
ncbi:MAG: tRNA-dihydrouridine synthase family protein [Hungatella sp.]